MPRQPYNCFSSTPKAVRLLRMCKERAGLRRVLGDPAIRVAEPERRPGQLRRLFGPRRPWVRTCLAWEPTQGHLSHLFRTLLQAVSHLEVRHWTAASHPDCS
jgi:hypothetical protein